MKKRKAVVWACLTILACFGAQTPKGQPGRLFPIIEQGKWGYIDRTGQVVIQPQFDYANDFSEGLALVSDGGLPTYIDEQGKRIFSVQVYGQETLSPHQFLYPKELRCPSFDPFILPFIGGCPGTHFSDGLARILVGGRPGHMSTLEGGQVGFIDQTGKVAIQPQFDAAWGFSEGLAAALLSTSEKGEQEYGYIDQTGAVVIPPQFRRAGPFSEGLAEVALDDPKTQTLKYGYIDKAGRSVIEPQFRQAHPFSEGLASVQKEGKFGFIDTAGQFVIPPQFDSAASFSEGLALVQWVPSSGRQYGYIDKQGQMAIKLHDLKAAPCSMSTLSSPLKLMGLRADADSPSWASAAFSAFNWQAQSESEWPLKRPMLPPPGSFSEGLASVSFDTVDRVKQLQELKQEARHQAGQAEIKKKVQLIAASCGYIDKAGQAVIQPQFTAAGPFRDGLAYVESFDQDGQLRLGYIDMAGNRVWEAPVEKQKADAFSTELRRWNDLPALQLSLVAKEKAAAGNGEATRYWFTVANRDSYPNEVFELSPHLRPPTHTRTVVGFYAVSDGRRLGEFVSVRSRADLDRIGFSVKPGEPPPGQVFAQLFDQQFNQLPKGSDLVRPKGSNPVNTYEKGEWQIFYDRHSSYAENSPFDVTQVAVRRQMADSVEFRIDFKQAVPDYGLLTVWADTDHSRDTGRTLWGDIGADRTIVILLGPGQAEVSGGGPKKAAQKVLQAIVEKSGNQALLKVNGWEEDDFDFVVTASTGPRWVDFPYPWSADICGIQVDGLTGDWGDRKPIWTSLESESAPAVTPANLRRLWLCNEDRTLFGRAEFSTQSALYGADLECDEALLSIQIEIEGRTYAVNGSTYQVVPRNLQAPHEFVVKSSFPDMEFEIKYAGSELFAPGTTLDLRIRTMMPKTDFIPNSAMHREGHLEFRSGDH